MNASGCPERRSATLLLVTGMVAPLAIAAWLAARRRETWTAFSSRRWLVGAALLLCAALPGLWLLLRPPLGVETGPVIAANELYHDFRGGGPLPSFLRLQGPEPDRFIREEAEGLRLTPPTDGRQTKGWGVALTVALSGDFEITGTYELLTVEVPVRGGGAGVALSLAPDGGRAKFTKIGRFEMPKGSSAHIVVSWDKGRPDSYKLERVPAATHSGQLRMVRDDSVVRFLAAEAPEAEFREIARRDFGAEEMAEVLFIANNNTSPTLVDARLIDLRIRCPKGIERQ